MKKSEDISVLLDKLSRGNLSKEETVRLTKQFANHLPDQEMDEWYAEEWKIGDERGVMHGADKILQQLHASVKSEQKEVIWYRQVWLRYAAVFVFAFASAWLVKGFLSGGRLMGTSDLAENVVTVANGSKTDVRLPDGTLVKLNSGSELHYPSVFSGNKREVTIDGEAYFEVTKDKTRPFYVKTSDLTVKVLGTVFNVKAYDEENRIETTLLEGSVEIYKEAKNEAVSRGSKPIARLEPHDRATLIRDLSKENERSWPHVDESGRMARFLLEKQVDCRLYTSWKDNVLRFNNEPFSQVVVRMERWYGVDIEIETDGLNDEPVTGVFDKETLEQALYAITCTLPFHYEITKSHIVIRR